MTARCPVPMRSRVAPPSLRVPAAAISPRTVATLLELLAQAGRTPAPAAPPKPVRVPKVKPTIIGIDLATRQDMSVTIDIAPPPVETTRSGEDGAMGSREAGDPPVIDPAPQPRVRPPASLRRAALEAKPRRRLADIVSEAVTRSNAARPLPASFTARRSPLEVASIAIAWLRDQRISVSVASTGIHGTRWNIANEGRPFDAADVIAFARSRGWSA